MNKAWRLVTTLQVFWGIGILLWNAYGLYQMQRGAPAPGPTASWAVAGIGLVIAAVFGFHVLRPFKWMFILACLIFAVLAFLPVYGAFTQDPGLWPSEAWRWAGIVLNGIGCLACLFAAVLMLQKQSE